MDYRNRCLLLCVGGFAMITLLVVAAALSPRTLMETVAPVTLSHESGFYDDGFYLEMKSDSGQIYYTLDSSDPDENAIPYTEPIYVADASLNENVYSMRTDVSVSFYEDLLAEAGVRGRYGYVQPKELIDKATVVRAVCIDEKGNRSEVTNGVYFVDFNEKAGYDGMYVACIATDPDNLFDYNEGIYVTGASFDKILVDGKLEVSPDADVGDIAGNYHNRGLNWEREAYAVVFNDQHELVMSGSFGLRIQGNSSRGRLPKGLNLFARSQYGQESFSAAGIFSEHDVLTSINFQSLTQGLESKMPDYLANTLTSDLAYATRQFVPCQLFLDGEYWGFYWIVPRFEKRFYQNKYGVRADTVVRIKLKPRDVDSEEDLKLYKEMEGFICENDMSNPELFARACDMIDIESCVDYYAAEIYIGNEDWPVLNTALWRVRDPEPEEYADGKWRWSMFDVNWSMERSWAQRDYVQRTIVCDPVFESLMQSETFSTMFYRKLVKLAKENFEPARVAKLIADYELLIAEPMQKEFRRFYGGGKTIDDFMDNCENIYRFFVERYDYIMNRYGESYE